MTTITTPMIATLNQGMLRFWGSFLREALCFVAPGFAAGLFWDADLVEDDGLVEDGYFFVTAASGTDYT
jgi:hypothetical protein